jgi:predicted  nucleic acid-binding Zn-ribbon protein
MSRVSSLHQLQIIDLELDRIDRRLGEIELILGDSTQIEVLQGKLDMAEQSLAEELRKAKSAEHTTQMQEEKIKKTEASLYSGTVTNPKELEDLQMEHESLQRYMATLEDRLLEAMVEVEQTEELQEQAVRALELAREARNTDHQDLVRERDELTKQVEKVAGEREPLLEGIAPEDLQLYESLRSRMSGIAVAVLEEDSCGACGLALPASEQQAIRSGANPVLCIQCGRILYGG